MLEMQYLVDWLHIVANKPLFLLLPFINLPEVLNSTFCQNRY